MTARGAGQPRHLCIERPYGELTPLASLETKLEQHTLDPLAIAKNLKNGFILAAFRAGTTPGEAKITISAEGLPTEEKTLSLK